MNAPTTNQLTPAVTRWNETPSFLKRTVDYIDIPIERRRRRGLAGIPWDRLEFAKYLYDNGIISDWDHLATSTSTADHAERYLFEYRNI